MTVNYARPYGGGGTWSVRFEISPDGKNVRLMRTSGWIHDIYTTEPYMNLADSIAIHDELRLLAREQRGIFRLIASQLKTESSIYRWIEELASKHQITF